MAIPSVAELLRRTDQPAVPTPAEIFAPFLLPGEELLWATYPNAMCHRRQHRRETFLVCGGSCMCCAVLAAVGYWTGGFSGGMLTALGLLILACAGFLHLLSQKQPELNYCFGVTSLRTLRYDAHAEDSNVRGMLLGDIRTLSVEAGKDGCGTICFNQSVLLFKSQTCFLAVDHAEMVTALILDAKHKVPTVL